VADPISEPDVLVTRDGQVATVTLNRPDALNALTPQMLIDLGDHLEALSQDPDLHVVVLTGEGRAFSAGVDLKALAGREVVNGMVGDVLDVPARRVTHLLSTMPQITIARVNGFCFTGALELAIACDVVIAAAEAKCGDTHAKFGLRPTWGMSQRLMVLAGPARARDLSYTARTFTGAEAATWGIFARAVPLSDLDSELAVYVESILANHPQSLTAYKDLYRNALDLGLDQGLAYEYGSSYEISDAASRVGKFSS
jgi:enoyl-CoA hydratase